jgi:hypothetical protein
MRSACTRGRKVVKGAQEYTAACRRLQTPARAGSLLDRMSPYVEPDVVSYNTSWPGRMRELKRAEALRKCSTRVGGGTQKKKGMTILSDPTA